MGSWVEEGLCVLMQNPVCSHTCVQSSASLCECVFGRAARRLLSQRVRRAGRLARHADRLKCYSLPKVRSALRKFVMLFHLSDFSMAGVRGRIFVLICCRHLNTHTLVCNRPVKVTKKFVWPCCKNPFYLLLFLSLVWDRSGPSSSSPILDRTYSSSSIHLAPGYTLDCFAFCQISVSVSLQIFI